QVRRGAAGRRPAAARQARRDGNPHGAGGRTQEARRRRGPDGGDQHPGGQGARPRAQGRKAGAGGDRPGRLRAAGVAPPEGDARPVLENKAGDCTEHTLLFVALARAAGLPAREVGGVAYVGGDEPAFGWHAWAEVHDGSQWVAVDPTWGQVFVDATHIKFSEG